MMIRIQSGQRILTTGRTTVGGFFALDNVTWHQAVWSIAHGCRSPAVAPILIFFCCIKRRSTDAQCFSLGWTNCPFPWGNLDTHLVHGYLGPPESSRSVQPFLKGSRTWPRNGQTHRQTTLCSNRPHLMQECMRRGLKLYNKKCKVIRMPLEYVLVSYRPSWSICQVERFHQKISNRVHTNRNEYTVKLTNTLNYR